MLLKREIKKKPTMWDAWLAFFIVISDLKSGLKMGCVAKMKIKSAN